MSTFSVPVVRVGKVGKHPNADNLSITQVEGCPCIFRTGDFQPNDLAIYIPVDALVPEETDWSRQTMSFLKFKSGKHRVKAAKIRGIFSMGILMQVQPVLAPWKPTAPELLSSLEPGDDLAGLLGITKYEEPEPPIHLGGEMEPDPGYMPVYDVESYRKYKHVFADRPYDHQGDIVVTEKIHGCNARFFHDGNRLWVGSHRTWKKVESTDVWNKVAIQYDLANKLKDYPMVGVYGEVYGDVQDLKYGAKPGEVQFRVFDVYSPPFMKEGRRLVGSVFLDHDEMVAFCRKVGLQPVPLLYVGPYDEPLLEHLTTGESTIAADHIREGIVIKDRFEGWHPEIGRTQLKLVSEAYLLRKGGTERH